METRGARLRALRDALELSQETVATAGGLGKSQAISKMESGANKITSHDARIGLAKAFGLVPRDFDSFIDGRMPLEDAVRLARPVRGSAARSGPTPAPVAADRSREESASPLEDALGRAFNPTRHTFRDVDVVREMLRDSHQLQRSETDMRLAARVWLDTAAAIRREGISPTVDEFLFRVTIGPKPAAGDTERAEQIDASALAEQKRRAKERGVEYGENSHIVRNLAAKKKR